MGTFDRSYIARETQLPFGGDRDSPGAVTATLEEIRHAEILRLRLRQTLLNHPLALPTPWCVGAD
jgi:hypothetical protein